MDWLDERAGSAVVPPGASRSGTERLRSSTPREILENDTFPSATENPTRTASQAVARARPGRPEASHFAQARHWPLHRCRRPLPRPANFLKEFHGLESRIKGHTEIEEIKEIKDIKDIKEIKEIKDIKEI